MHRSRILIADDRNLLAELGKKLLESEFEGVGSVSRYAVRNHMIAA